MIPQPKFKFIASLLTKQRKIYWTDIMVWFVEGVIGLNNRLKLNPYAPPLTVDDVRIDVHHLIHVALSSSKSSSKRDNAFSSDLSVFCRLFHQSFLSPAFSEHFSHPLDPSKPETLFAAIMIELVKTFTLSGDLLPSHHPDRFFTDLFKQQYHFYKKELPDREPFLAQNLSWNFEYALWPHKDNGAFILQNDSFLQEPDVYKTKQLIDPVREILKSHSPERVKEKHVIFEHFIKLVKSIAEKEETPKDITFLQKWYFQQSLISLQHFLLNTNFEAPNDHPLSPHETDPFPMDVQFEGIADLTASLVMEMGSVSSSSHASELFQSTVEREPTASSIDSTYSHSSSVAYSNPTHSLETALPSSLSIQDVITLPYLSTPRVEMLGMIHDLLSAPSILSPPPPPRPALYDVELHSSALSASSLELDLNERFDISLFDEEDDVILLQTLHRCYQCCRATKGINCIVDPLTFLERLVSTLSSRNRFIRRGSTFLIDRILSYIGFIDPRDVLFRSLRYSFRDGEREEQSTLLNLWVHYFESEWNEMNPPIPLTLSHFDFDGFVSADLSDPLLFDLSIMFLNIIYVNDYICSLDERTTLNIILQFERRNNALARLSRRTDVKQAGSSTPPFTLHHLLFAFILSVHYNIAFPCNLLEAIVHDTMAEKVDVSQIHKIPSFFVHHCSVDPRCDPHFRFLDLFFEQTLRTDPSQLVIHLLDSVLDNSPTLLYTPLFGLHSFFMRSQHLRLSSIASARLAKVIMVGMQPKRNFSFEMMILITQFPPPLLLRFFMSCQPLQLVEKHEQRFVMHTIWKLMQFTNPFGDCISLVDVFKMLLHTDPVDKENERMCWIAQSEAIWMTWFQIPSSFDSPLIAHVRSLHPSRHHILPSICEESEMSKLWIDRNDPGFPMLIDLYCQEENIELGHRIFIFFLRWFTPETIHRHTLFVKRVLELLESLLFPEPARVSLVLEFCKRFVQMCMDSERMLLVRNGVLRDVIVAASHSPFLEDYENGITMIGILLNTIRRVRLKEEMEGLDFLNSDDIPRHERSAEVFRQLKEDGLDDLLEYHIKAYDDPPWNKWQPIRVVRPILIDIGGNVTPW
ncbi:hypothetical protein BLNAU_10078 [Blattamonas nauphoetae]|uniref:Uncharacterized protein n=1 Tax=Blattamonas nauphoetae TaxID=2049346 RepID=A0ABQ9XTX9_9EUKA|nr:hypothetical protein BLNAU_10078 [Blattamonas nauphoetae]